MNKVHRNVWNEITRTFVAVAEIVRSHGKSSKQANVVSALQINPILLEQRFMFDGAAVTALVDPNLHTATDAHTDTTPSDLSKAIAVAETAVQTPQIVRAVDPALNNGRKEVAFIDTGVADYQTLVDGVRAGVEVVLLDAGQDGLAQMALWAQSHSGYDAIHVLSHGTQGSIFLGNTELNQALLSTGQVEHELSSIGTALNVGGDILLYGCDVAQYSAGQTFVKTLAQLTSSDVSASTDATGSNYLGGDWLLEYSIGEIETSSIMVERYQSLLATPTSGNTDFVAYAQTSGSYNLLATGTTNVSFIDVSDLLGWNISAHIPATSTYLRDAWDGIMASEDTNSGAYSSPFIYFSSNGGATRYDYLSFKSNDGKIFDFKNLNIDFNDASITTQIFTVAGYLGGALVTNAQISIQITADGDPASGFTLFNATTNSTVENAFKGVDEIRVIVGTPSASAAIDQLIFSSINAVNFRTASVADTTPPNAPSTPDLTVATDTGTSNTDNITSITTPVFTGTAEANSTVRLYDSNGTTLLGTATADGSGNWSITSSALSEGTHTLTVKATDSAGNTSVASSSLSVTIDTTAPTITVASAAFSADTGTSSTDFITKTAAQTISGTLSANLSSGETVYVSLDNGSTWTAATTTVGQNTWSLSGQTLTASNTLKVRVSDAAGNNGTAYSQAYVLDTTAPATTVATKSFSADTGSSSTDFITKTAAQTISGTLSANVASGEVVYVSLDNGATWAAATTSVGANTWSLSGQTLTGSNTLKVKVTDAAGNDGTVSSQVYVLDTTAPAAPSTPDMTSGTDSGSSNSDNITSNTTPVFSGTATANSIVTLYDTDGTTVLGTTTSDGSGNWSITSSTLSSGTHTVTAKATDTAGNESAASAGLSITVDTAAPSAIALSSNTISNSASANTAVGTLSSTDATVGDTFTYSLVAGAGSTDNASFSISGTSLVATNPSALSAGNYSVRVRTTDVAGNYFEQTFSITVTSNQAPAVTTPTAIVLTDTSSSDTFSNQTGTLSATDADGIASYGIQGGTTGGSDVIGAATYDVSKLGTYGTLYVKSSDGSYVYVPNASAINGRLTNTSETFTVTATDRNANAATGTATLTVNITGVNDLPTDIGLTATSVSQSGGANATVGTLSTTDADTGDTHTYSLVSGTGDTNNGLFNINGTSLRATNAASMASGTYTVRVQTTDAANATYTKVMTITVADDVAPTVTSVSVPSNAWYVAGQNLDFTVNFSESVTVVTTGGTPRIALTVGTTTVYATYLSGSGTSSLVFRYTVQANDLDTNGIALGTLALNGGTLADAAGNNAVLTLNSVGSTTAVLVDAVTPSAPSTPDLALASDTGTSTTDNITSDTTPTFTGTAEANSTVTLYDSNGTTVLGTATADGSGNWSITSSALTDGIHNLTTKVTDAAGNTGPASTGLTVTIDTTAPSASGTPDLASASDSGSSNTDNITSVTTPTITGGGAEAGSTVTLYDTDGTTVLGTATADGSGNWSITSNTLSSGTHTLTTKVTNAAGNTGSASAGLIMSVDTSVPAAPVAPDLASSSRVSSSSDNTTNTTTPTITGTAEAGSTVTLYDTDGTTVLGTVTTDGSGNWSITSSTLTLGVHTLTTKSTDAAGNTSSPSAALSVTVANQQVPPATTPSNLFPPSSPSSRSVVSPEMNAIAPVASFFSQSKTGEITGITIDSLINSLAPVINEKVVETASKAVSVGVRSGSGETFASGLSAINKLAEMEIPQGEASMISLPAGTFVHTDATARVSLSARLTDGKALPAYVKFNPTTGTFTVDASNRAPVDLQIRVIAVDEKGKTANTTVVIKIKGKSKSSSSIDALPISGKIAFTEQLKNSEKPSGLMSHLAALNKAFETSNANRSHS